MFERAPRLALTAVLLAIGCTDASLQLAPSDPLPVIDDRLAIRGEFCAQPDGLLTFPVKVLFVMDQSASLQCTDSRNRRFEALRGVLDTLRSTPNVAVGFVGFSSWSRELEFTRDSGAWSDYLDPSGGLGPATDYQGALATAIRMLETDMLATPAAERARTRYVVVFVSDGVAEPRCNAGCEDDERRCANGDDDDGDGLRDGADRDCMGLDDNATHPDNLYGICNTTEEIPDGDYVDFDGLCPAYNQPEQILARVTELTQLADVYSVGAVTLNTVLLFSPQAIVDSVCPGAGAAFGYDEDIARILLRSMARAGDGVFRDANLEATDGSFLRFDFAALEAPQWLSGVSVTNVHAVRSESGLSPDTDLDGLADDEEERLGTDFRARDQDSDGYGDLVESRFADLGCDVRSPMIPSTPCAETSDLDGDRLLDCEELLLETDPRDPDSDGDGLLDFVEVQLGTDARLRDSLEDPDFDGRSSMEEARAGTLPRSPEAEPITEPLIRYSIRDLGAREVMPWPRGDAVERHCYGFTADDIRLVTPPVAEDRGLNRVLVYASEAPAQLQGARAATRVACFEVFYRGERSKDPESGVIDATSEGWDRSILRVQSALDALGSCDWLTGAPARGTLDPVIDRCMPESWVLGRFAYSREALHDLVRRYLDGDAIDVPRPPSELFVPIETFDPARHCHRPWELDRLVQLFTNIGAACACEEPAVDEDGEAAWISPCCGESP